MRTPIDIPSLARLILSPECDSIAILTGAGVGVAAGIPDFRSPGGMYATLQPELITASERERQLMKQDPTYVVSWDIFKKNQFPYLEVRRPFILGTQSQKWKATVAHRFAELLHTKTTKLTRLYTQNIDGLDYQCTDIPIDKIVSVHGSIAVAGCEGCGRAADYKVFCDRVRANIKDIYHHDEQAPNKSSHILCDYCHKPLVKPKTMLFGRNLPSQFFECIQQDLPKLSLLIIAGTSLVVSPANSLVYSVPDSTIRVVCNRDPVGAELGIDYSDDNPGKRDFFAQGEIETIFLELIYQLGWMDDLRGKLNVLPEYSANLIQERYP